LRWNCPRRAGRCSSALLSLWQRSYKGPYQSRDRAINMRTRLAANGRFLAVVPAYIMRAPGKNVSLKVLPVELPTTHRQIGIVTLKNRTLSPLGRLFIECAREVAKPLAKGQALSARRKK